MQKVIHFIFFIIFSFSASAQGFQWVKKGGGTGADYGRDMAIDNTGNVYVCGSYAYQNSGSYSATFGTSSISNTSPGPNGYIAKYDESGNIIWLKNIEGPGWEYAYDITTDNNGNVFVAGEFQTTVTIDGVTVTTTTSSGDGTYLAKFLSNGNLVWLKSLEPNTIIDVADIITDASGDVWVTGNINTWNVYLRKYSSSNGTLINTIQSVNTSAATVYSSIIQKDNNGNVYLVGRYGDGGTVSIGNATFPPINQFGDIDIFIVKFNTNAVVDWFLIGGGDGDQDSPLGISTDIDGNIYLSSVANTTVTWGNLSLVNNTGNWGEQYFVKINSQGVPRSIKGFPININGYGGELHYPIIGRNIFFNMSFNDTLSIAGSNFTSTGQDHLIVAADTSLNIVGAYQIKQSTLSNGIDGIVANSNNDIYVTGYFRDLATFGTIPLNTTGGNKADMFLTKVTPCIPPILTLNQSGTINICQNNNVLVSATSNLPNVTFQWYQNSQPIPNATSSTFTIQQPGQYFVKASIGGGCEGTSELISVLATTINAQLQANELSVCSGSTTQIQTTLPYQSYVWSNGASGTSSITVAAGNYNVIVTDANNCIDTAYITINEYAVPSTPAVLVDANCWLACDTFLQTGAYKWRLYGNVIGSNTQYLNANLYGNGFYKVEITDVHGCKSTSNDQNVTCVVGVENSTQASNTVSIYPNPTSGNVTIDFKQRTSDKIQIIVTDILGQVILEKTITDSNQNLIELNLLNHIQGVYVVKIIEGNKEIQKRIMLL